MITVEGLTKTYGGFKAVDDVSFVAQPGRVTGFLGPNGAGKTTTMRVMVGLTNPTHGRTTIGGHLYRDLPNPGRHVGVLLDASAQHAGRTGREILTIGAETMGLPASRVDEMLRSRIKQYGSPNGKVLYTFNRSSSTSSTLSFAILLAPRSFVFAVAGPRHVDQPITVSQRAFRVDERVDTEEAVLVEVTVRHEVGVDVQLGVLEVPHRDLGGQVRLEAGRYHRSRPVRQRDERVGRLGPVDDDVRFADEVVVATNFIARGHTCRRAQPRRAPR